MELMGVKVCCPGTLAGTPTVVCGLGKPATQAQSLLRHHACTEQPQQQLAWQQ